MGKDSILQRLEHRHPIWKSNIQSWEEIDDVLFDHVKDNPERYVEKGDEESAADYERRLRFARFKGELSPILHRIVGAVTARPPSRPEAITNKWEEFIDNVDGCSTHLDQFLEDRLFETLGFGASVILLDRAMVDENGYITEITSKRFKPTLETRKIDSYDLVTVPYRISQVVDWSLDRCGEFHWVRLYETQLQSVDLEEDAEEIEIYREFDRTSWRVYEVRTESNGSTTDKITELVAEGNHDLGLVPLVVVSLQKEKEMSFYSPMRYAYHHDISNFIADSDLQYASWLHAHPTLIDFRANDEATRLTVGPGAVIRRNPEFNENASYLEFPKANTDQLRTNKMEAVEGLKRISGIDPLSGTQDPQAASASGRSRAISFSISEERHLRRAAKSLARAEQRLFEIAERWDSPEKEIPPQERLVKGRISYPQVFTSAGTEGLIEQWLATRDLINSETYDKEMQIKIIDSALGDISSEKRNLILQEVETNATISMMDQSGPESFDEGVSNDDFLQATREQESHEDAIKETKDKDE